METNNLTRELAINWFNSFSKWKQSNLVIKYLSNRPRDLILTNLTDSEIEKIYLRVNKKEELKFKEFSPELFKDYIDKFNKVDQIKARDILNALNL